MHLYWEVSLYQKAGLVVQMRKPDNYLGLSYPKRGGKRKKEKKRERETDKKNKTEKKKMRKKKQHRKGMNRKSL